MKNKKDNRGGFSLLEVLIVAVIAATIVIVVSNFGTNVNDLNGLISTQLRSKSDISQTLQILTNEIRSAEPSAAGAYAIDLAATSSFGFYTSVFNNGVIDHVRYFLSSSSIYRGIIAPVGTPATYPTSSEVINDMIDHVTLATSSALFSYYGSSYTGSGASLSSPVAVASVRLVSMSFYSTVSQNSSTPQAPQYFSTVVEIRNLNSN